MLYYLQLIGFELYLKNGIILQVGASGTCLSDSFCKGGSSAVVTVVSLVSDV